MSAADDEMSRADADAAAAEPRTRNSSQGPNAFAHSDVPSQRIREKVRIRFAKTGALRFIGHNDLLRCWDRLFRRAQIPVRFSEGFHPKPHMASPLSLALGVVGRDEVMEVELTEPMADDEIRRRLEEQADPGLGIGEIVRRPLREPTRVVVVEYECPLMGEPAEPIRRRAAEILSAATAPVERRHPKKGVRIIDARPFLLAVEVRENLVRFRLAVTPAGAIRPEEVLELLHIQRILDAGAVVTRTRVELAEPDAPSPVLIEQSVPLTQTPTFEGRLV